MTLTGKKLTNLNQHLSRYYQMKIGHAHIKVRDLNISEEFYKSVFGLKVTERERDIFVFMSATHMHHEIALQNVGPDAKLPSRHDVGLFHVAFEVPDKNSLADRYQHLTTMDIQPDIIDHRISWAIYFSDPDGNGLEIYCDTRHEHKSLEDTEVVSTRITPQQLLAEL